MFDLWGKSMGKIYGENLVSNSKHWPLMTIQGPLAVVGLATQSPPEGTGGSLVTLLVLNWCKIPSDGILIASGTGTMYLKPLVKQNWCKFRALWLHSTNVQLLCIHLNGDFRDNDNSKKLNKSQKHQPNWKYITIHIRPWVQEWLVGFRRKF